MVVLARMGRLNHGNSKKSNVLIHEFAGRPTCRANVRLLGRLILYCEHPITFFVFGVHVLLFTEHLREPWVEYASACSGTAWFRTAVRWIFKKLSEMPLNKCALVVVSVTGMRMPSARDVTAK